MGLRKGQSSSPVKNFDLKDFSGGWDLREGLYSSEQNRFTDLLNVYITVGKKIRRRPPLTKSTGTYDTANAQGLIYAGGKWYCIAKKGSLPTHSIGAIAIDTLLFDNPDYCTSWTLIQTKVFNNVVCAIIKHTFPGATMTYRYFLHVFDGKASKPTYVEDPACPTNWGPTFPLGLYGKQATVGTPDMTYVPVMGVGGSHLWVSRPDGNPACSKVNNPRYWNQRSVNDYLYGGEWWYFVMPNNGSPLRQFVVSENFDTSGNFAAWVLEYLDATGTWQKFAEDVTSSTPIVDKHYSYGPVASRFDATREIRLNVYWTGATDVVIRWRAITQPPVGIVSGCTWDPATNTLTGGVISFEGVNYTVTGEVVAGATDGSSIVTADWAAYFGVGAISLGSSDSKGAVKFFENTNAPAAGSTVQTGLLFYYTHFTNVRTHLAAGPSDTDAVYPYACRPGLEIPWYLAKLSDYTINQAGAGEASFLSTQNYNPNGGYLKAMGNLIAHMTFSYESCTQLWSIVANPANDSYQTRVDLGTGSRQSLPVPVNFYDLVVLPTPTGLRGFNMQVGFQINTLQDNNVGEPIMAAPLADLTQACWWPFLGCYVTAGVLSGSVQWYVLSESRESEVSAWSRWTAAGITTIEAMVPLQNRLYIKSGSGVYYFDVSQTITENGVIGTGVFRDSNDLPGAGNAYVSSGRWHFNDLHRPNSDKDFIEFDVVQQGFATWSFGIFPFDITAISASLPVPGTTMGVFPYSLGFAGAAISPQFSSTDETGFQIEGISIGFAYLGRG